MEDPGLRQGEIVTREQLEDLARLLPEDEPRNATGRWTRREYKNFDLETWLASHSVPVEAPSAYNDGLRWRFSRGGPCPFGGPHNAQASFIIMHASGAIAAGCHHNSCEGKKWQDLRKIYEPDYDPNKRRRGRRKQIDNYEPVPEKPLIESDSRLSIYLHAGRTPWAVDEEQKLLAERHRDCGIYEHGNLLVRMNVVEAEQPQKDSKIRRPVGAVNLRNVTVLTLEDVLTRAISFWKFRQQYQDWVPTDCPEKHAKIVLDRAGDRRLPDLLGIIEAPCLRPDGSVLEEPGYDEVTGLYLYSTAAWLPVPERPTRAQVEDAVRVLLAPFSQFRFVSEADKSVLLAAIFTGVQRRGLDLAPLFGFDSPIQASGKTLLGDCISLIATGRPPACVSAPNNEDEWRKLVTTLLIAGDGVVMIDNVVSMLLSAVLAKVLTSTEHVDRVLGVNKQARVPTNTLWMCNGNNLTLVGDMPSRAVVCRIDPKCERPNERHFAIADLRRHILNRRCELVQAVLTILRANFVAGRPQMTLKPSRFSRWDREIRASIVWVGLADPFVTRGRIEASDPERAANAAVLTAWHDQFGSVAVSTSVVIKKAEDNVELRNALLDVAADRSGKGAINPRRLGVWCRSHIDRIVAGFCLTKAEGTDNSSAQLWRVAVFRDSESAEFADFAESVSATPWEKPNFSDDVTSSPYKDELKRCPQTPQDSANGGSSSLSR